MTHLPFAISEVRPEVIAGGIVRDDVEIDFYVRVNSLLQPDMTLLDYGAGRGAMFSASSVSSGKLTFLEKLAKLQGRVKKVIGIDIDKGILEHPYLDERHVVSVNDSLPIPDQSVDLVVANYVLEHIEHPFQFASEMYRVLKPGGWICALTPHRWSYIGIAVCLIPDRMRMSLGMRMSLSSGWNKPESVDRDIFPIFYKLNTFRSLAKYFSNSKWIDCSYRINSIPRYCWNNRLAFAIVSAYHAVARPKTDIIVLLQKK